MCSIIQIFYFLLPIGKFSVEKKLMDTNPLPDWVANVDFNSLVVPFGSGKATQLLGERHKQNLANYFRVQFGEPKLTPNFPGSLAVTILRKNLEWLSKRRYEILLKTDGSRYWLICNNMFLDSNKNPFSICIDRNFHIYLLSIPFSQNIFRGTILDGELIHIVDGDRYEFQIFDCLMWCGKYVGRLGHRFRMEDLAQNQHEIAQPNNYFKFIMKRYIHPDMGLQCLYKPPYFEIDGWIVIDVNSPYVFGKDHALFKFKLVKDHTVDFILYKTDRDGFSFGVGDNKKNAIVKIQNPTGITDEDLERLQVQNEDSLENMILECEWVDNKIWKPRRIRKDKREPNNIVTYRLTVTNINENITPTEIYNAFPPK